jgi:pimeloyl-ACP methyl ester carboxylesterase
LVLIALAQASLVAQAPDLQSQGRALVNAMAKEQFRDVVTHFDDTMTAALSADKLASTWQGVIAQAGEFKSISATRQTERQGYQVILVSCHFAQHDLDTRIVYDAQGRVAGLFFVPPQAQPAASPGSVAKAAKPADLAGDWLGTLAIGAMNLRIVFHIKSADDGLHATLDSPDQSAYGLPVSSVQLKEGAVKLESEKVRGVFEGTISSDLSTLTGTWTQGAGSLPLSLKRVKDAALLQRQPRPQEPSKPYPYRAEDVAYDNKTAGNRLAATLTLPNGKGPFPAVVLITGSGPQDRDETVFNHKPFMVLADYLTRRGLAVLRADDRGTGESTGDFTTATTADFATDTEAGIAYLKSRGEINPRQIGLIGHSEGGIIAPMVAARNHDVAFIVMMAGSGVPGDQILVAQSTLLAEAAGKSHEVALKTGEREREILDLLKQNQDDAALQKSLREKLSAEMRDAQVGAAVTQLMSPWFRYFVNYDPAPALRKVTCPVLALNGEKDLQVPPKQNLPAIRKALENGGNKNFEADELPGLNHLFQTAKTGSLDEYATIDETIAPAALAKIAAWILKSGLSAVH